MIGTIVLCIIWLAVGLIIGYLVGERQKSRRY
jgi:uncharacterized protein YneF (UPF0154 family)